MKFNRLIKFVFFLLSMCYGIKPVIAQPNVWDVLRQQLKLNHELNRPEVQTQLRWLMEHPSYIRGLARAEPYMYHILTEIKKRNLPGEIALIPMIESTYDPFAYSGAGASGLWQFMPNTGKELGLKQDWWFDGRRSIQPSTTAALNYLTYLNKMFHGNWILAFAAYDAGEGRVARTIKASGQRRDRVKFWSLPLPRETQAYIPRLLALAEIIQNPRRYRVELPNIPHVPYFKEVHVGTQIDLNHAAQLAGISYKELIQLNPGFNRSATAPNQPHKLLIPTEKVGHFNRNLTQMKQKIQHSTSTTPIKNAPQFTQPEKYKVIHITQKTDTYQHLTKKYNVSVQEIKQWNALTSNAPLKAGTPLTIWKYHTPTGTYVIKKGDTLGHIAQRKHTKVSTLLKLNPGLNAKRMRPGQTIRLG